MNAESKSKAKVDVELQKQSERCQKQVEEGKKLAETPEPELHKAPRTGDVETLTQMLESACLNPQTGDGIVDPSVPWRGKPRHLVAKDGETRDAFRDCISSTQTFDWESAMRRPSMLTPEMELKREAKEKEFEEKKKKKEAGKEESPESEEESVRIGVVSGGGRE